MFLEKLLVLSLPPVSLRNLFIAIAILNTHYPQANDYTVVLNYHLLARERLWHSLR